MESSLLAPVAEPRGLPMESGNEGFGEAELRTHEQALRHLGERGFIQFHPMLAERLGHKAAVFLGLALYWTRHSHLNQPHRRGWFYMTARQWTRSCGLSSREQSTVRTVLLNQGLLQETLSGRPAMLHYRVNLENLARWLGVGDGKSSIAGSSNPTWEAVSQAFRGCVCFYKPLADLTGNVACGLYLSYLLQLQRKALHDGQLHAAALRVSQNDVSIALCLGPKVQRSARERLKLAGLMTEAGSALVRLNLGAILACLQAQDSAPLRRSPRNTAAAPLLSLVEVHRPAATPQDCTDSLSGNFKTAPLLATQEQRSLDLGLPTGVTVASHGGSGQAGQGQSALRTNWAAVRSLLGATLPPLRPAHQASREVQPGLAAPFIQQSSHGPSSSKVAENAKLAQGSAAENAKLDRLTVAESAKLALPKTRTHISITNTNTTTTHASRTMDNALIEVLSRRRRLFPDSHAKDIASSDFSNRLPHQLPTDGPSTSLIFPPGLDAAYLPGVRRVLAKAPVGHQQALLDELDGQLRLQGKTIHNPAGWLMGLIRQQQGQDLVLALAEKVATERAYRMRIQQRIDQAAKGAPTLPPPAEAAGASPADPAIRKSALEKLRLLRNEISRKDAA